MDESTGLERYDAAGAAFGSYIAIMGGHGKGTFHNDLYFYFTPEPAHTPASWP